MSAPEEMTLKVIAHIRTAFPTKFGIPRQSETVMLLADNTAVCPPMVFAGPQLEEIQIEGRAVGFCRGL